MSESTMGVPDLESARHHLEGIRSRILREVIEVEDDLADVRSSEEIDPADLAQRDVLGRVLAKVDDLARQELEDAEVALQRIDAGIYGLCEDCGEPIAVARLEALPAALRCEACQEAVEAQETERQSAGG